MLIKLRPMSQKAKEALIHEQNIAKEVAENIRKKQIKMISKAHKAIKINSANTTSKWNPGSIHPRDSKKNKIQVGDIIHIAVLEYRSASIREGVVTSLTPGYDEYHTGTIGYVFLDDTYRNKAYKMTRTSKSENIIIVGKYKVPS